jgi:hypothetical protein
MWVPVNMGKIVRSQYQIIIIQLISVFMGNRLMWENRAGPDVSALSGIHCIYVYIVNGLLLQLNKNWKKSNNQIKLLKICWKNAVMIKLTDSRSIKISALRFC